MSSRCIVGGASSDARSGTTRSFLRRDEQKCRTPAAHRTIEELAGPPSPCRRRGKPPERRRLERAKTDVEGPTSVKLSRRASARVNQISHAALLNKRRSRERMASAAWRDSSRDHPRVAATRLTCAVADRPDADAIAVGDEP